MSGHNGSSSSSCGGGSSDDEDQPRVYRTDETEIDGIYEDNEEGNASFDLELLERINCKKQAAALRPDSGQYDGLAKLKPQTAFGNTGAVQNSHSRGDYSDEENDDEEEDEVYVNDNFLHAREDFEEDNLAAGRSDEKSLTMEDEMQNIDKLTQKRLALQPELYFDEIVALNDVAARNLQDGMHKEALATLTRAESMLEFAASCGKVIDRNLIVVVLYNRACAYQSLWVLDKCSNYIDAVIFNLEKSLEQDDQDYKSTTTTSTPSIDTSKQQQRKKTITTASTATPMTSSSSTSSTQTERETLAYRIKKQMFLVQSYLQCCAILSQQGFHTKALKTAREGSSVLRRIFKECQEFCREAQRESEIAMYAFQSSLRPSSGRQSNGSLHQLSKRVPSEQNFLMTSASSGIGISSNQPHISDHIMDSMNASQSGSNSSRLKNPINTNKEDNFLPLPLLEYASSVFSDILSLVGGCVAIPSAVSESTNHEDYFDSHLQDSEFSNARKSIYFWKNNPDNNEKHIRQGLHAPARPIDEDQAWALSGKDYQEWIETFNIGSIMHMTPVKYQQFSFIGDLSHELSKRMVLEKVVYMSINYFMIATEIRFVELEQIKPAAAPSNSSDDSSTSVSSKLSSAATATSSTTTASRRIEQSDGFEKSQLFHLKSIEIVCKHITCNSPYINHLITSYHKHYNQILETIKEESFYSVHDAAWEQQNTPVHQRSTLSSPFVQTEAKTNQFTFKYLAASTGSHQLVQAHKQSAKRFCEDIPKTTASMITATRQLPQAPSLTSQLISSPRLPQPKAVSSQSSSSSKNRLLDFNSPQMTTSRSPVPQTQLPIQQTKLNRNSSANLTQEAKRVKDSVFPMRDNSDAANSTWKCFATRNSSCPSIVEDIKSPSKEVFLSLENSLKQTQKPAEPEPRRSTASSYNSSASPKRSTQTVFAVPSDYNRTTKTTKLKQRPPSPAANSKQKSKKSDQSKIKTNTQPVRVTVATINDFVYQPVHQVQANLNSIFEKTLSKGKDLLNQIGIMSTPRPSQSTFAAAMQLRSSADFAKPNPLRFRRSSEITHTMESMSQEILPTDKDINNTCTATTFSKNVTVNTSRNLTANFTMNISKNLRTSFSKEVRTSYSKEGRQSSQDQPKTKIKEIIRPSTTQEIRASVEKEQKAVQPKASRVSSAKEFKTVSSTKDKKVIKSKDITAASQHDKKSGQSSPSKEGKVITSQPKCITVSSSNLKTKASQNQSTSIVPTNISTSSCFLKGAVSSQALRTDPNERINSEFIGNNKKKTESVPIQIPLYKHLGAPMLSSLVAASKGFSKKPLSAQRINTAGSQSSEALPTQRISGHMTDRGNCNGQTILSNLPRASEIFRCKTETASDEMRIVNSSYDKQHEERHPHQNSVSLLSLKMIDKAMIFNLRKEVSVPKLNLDIMKSKFKTLMQRQISEPILSNELSGKNLLTIAAAAHLLS